MKAHWMLIITTLCIIMIGKICKVNYFTAGNSKDDSRWLIIPLLALGIFAAIQAFKKNKS